jgi:hypothetical protein
MFFQCAREKLTGGHNRMKPARRHGTVRGNFAGAGAVQQICGQATAVEWRDLGFNASGFRLRACVRRLSLTLSHRFDGVPRLVRRM